MSLDISKNAFDIARLLLDPSGGDVVFVARAADDSLKKLYAIKAILTAKSEYFARSISSTAELH
jgi:hypothetical protein